jgi:predicted amidohydrolase
VPTGWLPDGLRVASGSLSKYKLHIVLGIHERAGHLVYKAVLLGPEGKLIGKYHKVCLPPSEVADGLTPGSDYPVFDTKIGKVGLMVCYDGFFPEVARELSNREAEIHRP